ncbi:SRPBCC family protein [Ostreiculturibacter nitratireducens]|uniref:SRPBCC family protein n=1 Tax=Ostreiculturibacter nitratireducens TaxID=3075226 RepID=UPI0031B5B7A5
MTSPDESLDLELRRHLAAPRASLWRCWTEPELLKQWLCPKPWGVSTCVVDLRPGGRFLSTMLSPEGEEFPNDGAWLEVVPGERLVFTTALREGWRPSAAKIHDLAMTAVLSFADAPGGGTSYHVRVMHADAEGKARHEAMGFHEGWGVTTDQLEELALTL